MATQPNPMTAEAGQQLLLEQVYVPTFLQKMASFGYDIRTEEQAQSLLRQAHALRFAAAEENVKHAAATNDPLLLAEQRLYARLQNAGLGDYNQDAALEQYAAKVAQERPDLSAAAIAYQNGIAETILAQNNG